MKKSELLVFAALSMICMVAAQQLLAQEIIIIGGPGDRKDENEFVPFFEYCTPALGWPTITPPAPPCVGGTCAVVTETIPDDTCTPVLFFSTCALATVATTQATRTSAFAPVWTAAGVCTCTVTTTAFAPGTRNKC